MRRRQHYAPLPACLQVVAGQGPGGALALYANTSGFTSGNASTTITIAGQAPATLFDIHLVAIDRAGNQQRAVTSLM